MSLNFQAESRSPVQGSHPGGLQFAMGVGSVRFLKSTDTQLIVDRDGGVVEIRAEMVDTRSAFADVAHLFWIDNQAVEGDIRRLS